MFRLGIIGGLNHPILPQGLQVSNYGPGADMSSKFNRSTLCSYESTKSAVRERKNIPVVNIFDFNLIYSLGRIVCYNFLQHNFISCTFSFRCKKWLCFYNFSRVRSDKSSQKINTFLSTLIKK